MRLYAQNMPHAIVILFPLMLQLIALVVEE